MTLIIKKILYFLRKRSATFLKSNLFKYFTAWSITLGIIFIFINAWIKFYLLTWDFLLESGVIDVLTALTLGSTTYMGYHEDSVKGLISHMQAWGAGGNNSPAGGKISMMQGDGANSGGANTSNTGSDDTGNTTSGNNTLGQAGPSNFQQGYSYNYDPFPAITKDDVDKVESELNNDPNKANKSFEYCELLAYTRKLEADNPVLKKFRYETNPKNFESATIRVDRYHKELKLNLVDWEVWKQFKNKK